MKIFISGKISGIEQEAFNLFEAAENEWLAKGYEVVNPMKLPEDHDKSWESYMKVGVRELMICDEIFMLNNWQGSTGAICEHELAERFNIKINYQDA